MRFYEFFKIKLIRLFLILLLLSGLGIPIASHLSNKQVLYDILAVRYHLVGAEQAYETTKTPFWATVYLLGYLDYETDKEIFGMYDSQANFREIHRLRKGDCDEGLIASQVLLAGDGHGPPEGMIMLGVFEPHAVGIYRESGKMGTLGILSSDNTPPIFESYGEIPTYFGYNEGYLVITPPDGDVENWIESPNPIFVIREIAINKNKEEH